MTAQRIAGLKDAREAAARYDWALAYEAFGTMDPATLEPSDLEAFADAAWWNFQLPESIDLRQKAHAGYVAAGNVRAAARVAWFLFFDYIIPGETSVAMGWLKRAQRHLTDLDECIEHGLIALAEARVAFDRGDLDRALELADRVVTIGERFRDRDAVGLGLDAKGRFLVARGEVERGMELLEEAMTAVIAGEVSPFVRGWMFCDVLGTCMQIADLRRANQWTDAATAWSASMRTSSPFTGICRVHRVEVAVLRGEWETAESEALRAAQEMATRVPPLAGEAMYMLGEICRRRGDVASAEEAFTRAHEMGRDPQPGLALIRLAQGKGDAAAAGLRNALWGTPGPNLPRATLLAAQVEVDLARGDLTSARAAADQLDAMAAAIGSELVGAMGTTARAAVHLAAGEIEPGFATSVAAFRSWQELRLPYETAHARLLVADASKRGGDEERARLELDAARAAFERLGAKVDARRAAERLRDSSELPAGLSAREVEVLKLVAAGKTNREIAAEMVISEHTVSRHLQNIFAKLGVSSRAAATAFAFENQLV